MRSGGSRERRPIGPDRFRPAHMVLIPIDPPPAYLQRTPSTGGFGSSPSRHSSRPSLPPAHSGFSMASRIKTTSSVVPSARRTAGPRFSTEEFDTQLDAIEAQRREEFERVKMKRPESKGATTRVIGRGASVALLAAKKKLRDASAKSLPASHPQSTSFDGDTDDEGEALRLEPACAAALSLYWRTAKAADGARTAGDRGVTFVRKASYILLSVKLAKALRDDFRAKDAVAVAEEEWREYAGRGREAIGQKAFEEAILAVAEVHNGSTGAAECAEFLTELWGRVAHADDAGVCHWREDDEIGYWPRERASLVARRRRTSDLEDAELPTLTEDGGDVPWSPVDTRRSSRQWTPPGQPSLAPSSSLPDLSRRREDLGMPPLPDLTIESLDLARIEAEAEAEAAAEAAAAAAAAPPVVVEPPIGPGRRRQPQSPLPPLAPPSSPDPFNKASQVGRLLRAYWAGGLLSTSWAARIEHCRLNQGFLFIGVCDARGQCGWGLQPYSGLLYRISRSADGRLGFDTPPPAGCPDGNRSRVLVDANGAPADLRGRAQDAVIACSLERDEATGDDTLCFRVNGGPMLPALSGFPPGAALRQWALVVDPHDRVRVAA